MMEKTVAKCIACNSSKVKYIVEKSLEWGKLLKCSNCGHITLILSQEAEAEHSEGDYWDPKGENFKIYNNPDVQADEERKYKIFLEEIEKATTGRRLLDIGCGLGHFLYFMEKRDWDGAGLEPSTYAHQNRLEGNFEHKVGLVDTYKGAVNEFDLVTLWDVIEHLENPFDVLKRIRSLLKSKGYIILETPNEDCLLRKVIKLVYITTFGWINLLPYLYYPAHLHYFTPKSMNLLCKRLGMNMEAVGKVSSSPTKILLKYKAHHSDRKWFNLINSLMVPALKVGSILKSGNKMLIKIRNN